MSRKTCVRFVLGCLLTAAVGIAANASADTVETMMLDSGPGLGTYTACNGEGSVFTEAVVLNGWGVTVCRARAFVAGAGWTMNPCNASSGTLSVRLRTWLSIKKSSSTSVPDSTQFQTTQYMSRNGGDCFNYTVTSMGGAW